MTERTKKKSIRESDSSVKKTKLSKKTEGLPSLKRKELLEVLNKASSALSTQDYVPILTHFCFDEKTVTAYNDIQAININFESGIRGGVPGQMLMRTLGSYNIDTLYLDQPNKNSLEVYCGESHGKFAVLGEEHFSFFFKDLELDDTVEIPLNKYFAAGIQNCLVNVGKDPTHSFQLGITFAYSKKGVTLYSTDNTSISKYVIPGSKTSKSGTVIIPESFCTVLLSFLRSYKTAEAVLKIGKGFAYVSIGEEARLFTKLVDEQKPINFEYVFEENTKELDFDLKSPVPEELSSVLERSLIFHSKNVDKSMSCKVEGSKLTAVTDADGVGRIKDIVVFEAPISEKVFEYKVDPFNLMRMMDICSDILITPKVTALFSENFTHLVGYYKD